MLNEETGMYELHTAVWDARPHEKNPSFTLADCDMSTEGWVKVCGYVVTFTPPTDKQRKIDMLAAIDKKIELNLKEHKQLQEARQRLLAIEMDVS